MSLLTVNNLSVRDLRTGTVLVHNMTFSLETDTCLGIVGESGSGKTLACTAMLGLASPWLATSGEILFDGIDLLRTHAKTLREIRGARIAMILQNPMTAFDPIITIGRQMVEALCQKTDLNKKRARTKALNALDKMKIRDPESVLYKYPHQLSGGMLQRCMIALTLSLKPDLVIADEPTTALDTINQQEVINSFIHLRKITGTTVIFISHDLGVVRHLAREVLVMRNGHQVEIGPAEQIFQAPGHAYTKYLIGTRKTLARSFIHAMAPIPNQGQKPTDSFKEVVAC